MKAVWHPTALDQLTYWINEDPKIATKILARQFQWFPSPRKDHRSGA